MNLANTSGVNDRWLSPAAGYQGANTSATFDRSIHADIRLVAGVRADLRTWLAAHSVGDDDRDAIVLACSEAVANAIEHAYRGMKDGIVVLVGHIASASVELSVHDDGEWVAATPDDPDVRGRGLALIARLMDAASIDVRDGTTVLMRRDLRP